MALDALELAASGTGGAGAPAGSSSSGTQFFYNAGATVGISSTIFILALVIFAFFMFKKH